MVVSRVVDYSSGEVIGEYCAECSVKRVLNDNTVTLMFYKYIPEESLKVSKLLNQ